jgi:hypothetical protein
MMSLLIEVRELPDLIVDRAAEVLDRPDLLHSKNQYGDKGIRGFSARIARKTVRLA